MEFLAVSVRRPRREIEFPAELYQLVNAVLLMKCLNGSVGIQTKYTGISANRSRGRNTGEVECIVPFNEIPRAAVFRPRGQVGVKAYIPCRGIEAIKFLPRRSRFGGKIDNPTKFIKITRAAIRGPGGDIR